MNLNDLTYSQLEQTLTEAGFPRFRAQQLFGWFAKGVLDFSAMGNISKDLASKLEQVFSIATAQIAQRFVSKLDGTVKYLLRLGDGSMVESVAMRYKHGLSLCISTQVGCNMGCKFCASTIGGKVRNLTAGEILAQVSLAQRDLGERISNIVLMGIGEPLDNFDAVITFLENVNNEKGLNIGYRHISLSTCGLVDKMEQLARRGYPITLSVSLHAPNNTLRDQIMPINKVYPVERLLEACRSYIEQTGRRISFEYILIDGFNDTDACAQALAKRLRGMLCHVNLIPANFVEESGLRGTSRQKAEAFRTRLEQLGLNATVRRELGSDIAASCGQLRKRYQQQSHLKQEER